jgi:hypothetical protein
MLTLLLDDALVSLDLDHRPASSCNAGSAPRSRGESFRLL